MRSSFSAFFCRQLLITHLLIPTYASCRSKPPSDSFSVTDIPGTAPSIDRYFYIQFATRAGRSLLSDAQYVYGSGVRVTINQGAILENEDVFWIVISCESTYDEQDAAILAQIKVRNNDQLQRRSLPIILDFTSSEDFVNNRAVTTFANLPSTGLSPGAIAFVADTGIYYRYDLEAIAQTGYQTQSYGAILAGYGRWVEYNGTFNAYLASTSDLGGCDRVLGTVENALKTPPKIGAANGTPQYYWLNNGLKADGESPIVRGKYTLDISVDGAPGYESVFANKIRYTLIGYVDRETLAMDTAIATVGQPKLWNPTDGLIELPAELPRNHAAVYSLRLVFDNDDLIGKLPSQNASLSLNFVEVLNIQGAVSEIAKVIGDLVFSDQDKLLIVPGLKRLSGLASIDEGYIVEQDNDQLITGLLADTGNQKVVISGNLNGYASVKPTLDYSDVLRAIFSTEPGIGQLYSAGTLTLSSDRISVNIEHPLTIDGAGIVRSDYQDTLIAGNQKAQFTVTNCYVFLELGSIKYQSAIQLVAPVAIQVITLDLADFSVISNFPVQPDNYFSLFAPDDVSTVISGTGGLTGSATVYFAYAYESPNTKATKINNEALNTIPTARYTLAESINRSLVRDQNLNDLPDKAIARDNLDVYPKSELDAHEADTNNPHVVTSAQIGAATATQVNQLATVQGDHQIAIDSFKTETYFTLSTPTFTALVESVDSWHYLVDTLNSSVTANLDSSPAAFGRVRFSDRRHSFATNNLTINPGGGETINGQSSLVLDTNGQSVTLIFDSTNNNYLNIM